MAAHPSQQASPSQVVLNLGLVYVLWGSTYLAIRFAVETLPPFLMAATRFLLAGVLLYVWMRMRGVERPRAAHWRSASVVGLLVLLGANGAVVWAEQWIPSALAALSISTVPLFTVLLEWIGTGKRPPLPVAAGLLLGLIGVVVLVDPTGAGGNVAVGPALVATAGAVAWAFAAIYGRRAEAHPSALLGSAMQMLAGGTGLLVLSLVTGEARAFDPGKASFGSVLALLYLVVFGSLVGFSAYSWLMRNVRPALASTYAYVNPVVAVFLGWLLGGEEIGLRTVVASALIVGALALITGARTKKPAAEPVPLETRLTAAER